ncbi:MAG: hypothetical protein SGJ20_08775 [Planctomycetota bacterium]|nr:hypothetical protein [Planctomycetota bacterium]
MNHSVLRNACSERIARRFWPLRWLASLSLLLTLFGIGMHGANSNAQPVAKGAVPGTSGDRLRINTTDTVNPQEPATDSTASDSNATPVSSTLPAAKSGAPNRDLTAKAAPALMATEPLKFRQVRVPEAQIANWPSTQRLVPMSKEEFNRRIAQLESTAANPAAPTTSALVQAEYEAVLQGKDLTGQGQWIVKHVGEKPATIWLGSPRQPIINPIWIEPATLDAATLGVNAAGQTNLRVKNSGKIRFQWSAKADRQSNRDLVFHLSLAQCAVNRLHLTLPAEWRPKVEQGVVGAPQRTDDGQLKWTVMLGGNSEFDLRLEPISQVLGDGPTVLCKTTPSYVISAKGLQLSAEWKVEPLVGSTQQLAIEYHPSLTLLSVRQGDSLIPWSVQSSSENAPKRVLLQFAEPIEKGGRTIRLLAVAPLNAGKNWRLPRIYPAAAIRHDGPVTLQIDSPIVLNRLTTSNCRQTKRQQIAGPQPSEAFAFQPLTSDAEIDVQVAARRDLLQAEVATSVEFLGTEVKGRLEANLRAIQGDRFQIAAEVSPDWIIESVSSSPPDLVADWERQRSSATSTLLTVQLARNVNAERPVRLIVNAQRRRAGLEDTMRIDDLRIVDFQDIAVTRQIVALRSVGPYRLDFQKAENLTRLDARNLSTSDAALLGANPKGLLFVVDAAAEDMRLRLVREVPQFSGAIRVQTTLSNDSLTESYRFECIPAANELDRVVVHFSEARSEPPQWSVENEPKNTISARKLTGDQCVAIGAPLRGETWEVTLQNPLSDPFALLASRVAPSAPTLPLALASLVQSTSQRGEIVIRSIADAIPDVQYRRLVAIPSPAEAPGQVRSTLITLEYQPNDDLFTPEGALVSLQSPADNQLTNGWIWNWHTDAYLDASGTLEQHATIQVEAAGKLRLQAKFSGVETVPVVIVNGVRAKVDQYDAVSGELGIDLPRSDRFPTVELIWRTAGTPLSIFSHAQLSTPTVNIPVLKRSWTVWLPPGLELADSASGSQAFSAPQNSWTKRLFGPLGRGADQDSFKPWSRRDWQDVSGGQSASPQVELCAQELIEQLRSSVTGSTLGSSTNGSTFGEKIYAAWIDSSKPLKGNSLPLLIHVAALQQAGLDQRSTFASEDGTIPRSRSAVTDELMVLVHPKGLLLTTESFARQWIGSAEIKPAGLQHISAGTLSAAFDSGTLASTIGPVVPVETWISLPPTSGGWKKVSTASATKQLYREWTTYHFTDNGTAALNLWIVRPATVRSLACALFLLTALAFWKIKSFSGPMGAILLGICAFVAMLLPTVLISLGAAAFVGILFGAFCRRFTPIASDTDHNAAVHKPELESTASRAVMATVLLTIACWASSALAQTTVDSSASPTGTIFEVVIPIDDRQQPTGDTYYLPESFYQELIRRTPERPAVSAEWLLIASQYEGDISRGNSGILQGSDWKMNFRIVTFTDNAQVRLPLSLDEIDIVPGSITLDGKPLAADFDFADGHFIVSLETAGIHQLQIGFRPQLGTGTNGVFDFAIPSCPNSTIELSAGNLSSEIDLTIFGVQRLDPATNRISGQIGNASRAIARLDESIPRDRSKPEVDADELLWLKVKPSGTQLDVRWNLNVRRGQLRNLKLQLDPRWQMLPPSAVSNIRDVSRHGSQGNQVTLHFTEPVTDQQTVDLSFIPIESLPQTPFAFPTMRLLEADEVRRFVALSVDPMYEPTIPEVKTFASVTPLRFASIWGVYEATPLVAAQQMAPEAKWELRVAPLKSLVQTSERTWIHVGREAARWHWSSDLVVTGDVRSQLRLKVPPDYEVSHLELRDQTGLRNLRWSRLQNEVSVFLESPLGGSATLAVHGQIPLTKTGVILAQSLRMEDAVCESGNLLITRDPNTQVSIGKAVPDKSLSELQSVPTFQRLPWDEAGADTAALHSTLVAAFAIEKEFQKLALQVASAPPTVTAQQVTVMSRTDDIWMATVHWDLTVASGVLDEIRVNVPANWKGPFELSPALPYETVVLPGEDRQQVIVRLDGLAKKNVQLQMQAPVNAEVDRRIRVPMVELLGMSKIRNLLVLPTEHNLQRLEWNTGGLSEPSPSEPLPDELKKSLAVDPRSRVYSVISQQFQPDLFSTQKIVGDPQVRLAEIALVWNDGSIGAGTATFDLDPAGAASCLLALPPGHELVSVTTDGNPANLLPVADLRWRVRLSAGGLPQRIAVIYRGSSSDSIGSNAKRFQAPELVGLPVHQTIWTIAGPRDTGVAKLQHRTSDERELSSVEFELLRLKSMVTLMEEAESPLSELPSATVQHWYAAWLERYVVLRSNVEREIKFSEQATKVRESKLQLAEIDARQSGLTSRLAKFLPIGFSVPVPGPGVTQLAMDTSRNVHSPIYIACSGKCPSVEVNYPQRTLGSSPPQMPQALLVSGTVLAAAWLLTSQRASRQLERWPRVAGVALGVFWWLFLSPSWIGWLIVAACVLSPSIGPFADPVADSESGSARY